MELENDLSSYANKLVHYLVFKFQIYFPETVEGRMRAMPCFNFYTKIKLINLYPVNVGLEAICLADHLI